eukprot:1810027-Ditylum_brightwellii.AAC.1
MAASQPNIPSTDTTKGEKWQCCPKHRNVRLGIGVRDVDINDGVGVTLPKVTDQDIATKAIVLLFVVAGDRGDLGFLR